MIEQLMIGNYVHLYKGITDMKAVWDVERICAIEYDRVRVRNSSYWHAIENVEPIPLTEDILIRCGFVWNESWSSFIYKGFMVEKIGDVLVDRKYGKSIKYLHTLQNLVKLLCNQTIELKCDNQ